MSGSSLFGTQMVFLKEFFEKVDFESKKQQTTKRMKNFPGGGGGQRVNCWHFNICEHDKFHAQLR